MFNKVTVAVCGVQTTVSLYVYEENIQYMRLIWSPSLEHKWFLSCFWCQTLWISLHIQRNQTKIYLLEGGVKELLLRFQEWRGMVGSCKDQHGKESYCYCFITEYLLNSHESFLSSQRGHYCVFLFHNNYLTYYIPWYPGFESWQVTWRLLLINLT